MSLDILHTYTTIWWHVNKRHKMLITLWDQLFLHFWVGVSVALLCGLPIWFKGRKRYFLHFKGDDPVSLGDSKLWIIWYILALAFELTTSFMTHRLYVEVALSAFQAVTVTMGAYVVDRLLMMFEAPELYPRRTDIVVKPVRVIETKIEAPNSVAQLSPSPEQPRASRSWISEKFQNLLRGIARTPKATVDHINESLAEQSAERARSRSERIANEQAEEQAGLEERKSRLNDLTGKF